MKNSLLFRLTDTGGNLGDIFNPCSITLLQFNEKEQNLDFNSIFYISGGPSNEGYCALGTAQ